MKKKKVRLPHLPSRGKFVAPVRRLCLRVRHRSFDLSSDPNWTRRVKNVLGHVPSRDHAYAQSASLAGTEKAHDKDSQRTVALMAKLIFSFPRYGYDKQGRRRRWPAFVKLREVCVLLIDQSRGVLGRIGFSAHARWTPHQWST